MRKWILVGGAIMAATIIVAAGVVLNINSLIARNKDYLIDQAEQALGRKLRVGEVEATVLSGLGVRLTEFAMSEDPDYGAEDFVRARDLQVNLKLWPLLRKEVEVKRLILHDPVIHVIRNQSGEFNFSTIGKKPVAKPRGQEEKKPGAKERPGAKQEAPPVFLASLIDIAGGDLRYIDRADGTDLQLRQVDLKIEDLEFNRPFNVKLAAAVYADQQNFKLTGMIGPLRSDGDWTQIPLAGELNIDSLDLTRIKKAAPKLRNALSKEFDLSGIFRAKSLRFKGTLKDLALNGDLDGTQGEIRYGKAFYKPVGVALTLTTDARYAGKRIAIRQSALKLHTLELTSAGEIEFGGAPTLNLSIEAKPASIDGWGKLMPAVERYHLKGNMEGQATVRGAVGKGAAPQVQGTLILKSASAQPPDFPKPIERLDTVIKFTGQRADIRDMTLTLGRSRIQLAAAIEKFSPLTFTYTMSTAELWPADYTSAALSEERKADVVRNLRSEGRLTAAGANLAYQGKLSSADGTFHNVGYKNLEATLALADKVAHIETLRVDALSGQIQARGEYAFKTPTPSFSVASKMQGIDVKELYTALDAKAERDIHGRLNADMKLSGSGKSWEEIKPGLRGQGDAEIVQGVIYNFNIAESAMSGVTGIPGLTNSLSPSLRKKYPETFTAKDTEFKELKTMFDVADGRINLKNMRMSAAEFVVVGNGWTDFNRRVESRATLTFSQRLSADLAQSTREIKYLLNKQGQLELPFSVSGQMPNVKARPDANYLGDLVQRNFMRRGAEDLQNRYLGGSERSEEKESATDANTKKKRSTEDRIRRGLENLFRR
jgi:uncharacterized protein involved in outer membrane biogenesis